MGDTSSTLSSPIGIDLPVVHVPTEDPGDSPNEFRRGVFDDQVRSLETGDGDVRNPSAMMRLPVEIATNIFIICRDNISYDEDINLKSTLNPHQAPLILCHICSAWRTVAQATPRLWDVVWLLTEDLGSDDKIGACRAIFDRSGNLPLTVKVVTAGVRSAPMPQVLFQLWEIHPRLEHLFIDIALHDVALNSLPPPIAFPLLRSLGIIVNGHQDIGLAMTAILGLFRTAPSLRSLDLTPNGPAAIGHIYALDFFPWHQLTTVRSFIPITSNRLRTLFYHCRALQFCDMDDIRPEDPHHDFPLCIAENMRSLRLAGFSGQPVVGFFDSFAFPKLESLALECLPVSRDSLLGLPQRSKFRLKNLEITSCGFWPDSIIELLRLLPMLETLSLAEYTKFGPLFGAFTYRGVAGSAAQLSLLHLTGLRFSEKYDDSDDVVGRANAGIALAEMAESLFQYPRGQNLCFPVLQPVQLRLEGPKFASDIEDRLAAVCSAGYIID